MKVVVSDKTPATAKKRIFFLAPCEPKVLDKTNSILYDLRTIPSDANSTTFRFALPIMDGTEEDVETILNWGSDVDRVIKGLNLTTYTPMVGIAHSCLRGTPLFAFNSFRERLGTARREAAAQAAAAGQQAAIRAQSWEEHHTEVIDVAAAIQGVVAEMTPRNVCKMAKRELRRGTRKPSDMSVRIYANNIQRINNEGIAKLPPFAPNQALTEDEMIDILLHGTPTSWQREMDRQGFDPMGLNVTFAHVVAFMERIESAEEFDGTKVVSNDKKKKSNKSDKADKYKKPSANGELYCMLHGKGNHATEDCIKLKNEAKKMKSGSSSGDKSSKSKSNNKSWKKDASKSTDKSKSDLAALTKVIKQAVRKELHVADKKRKSSDDSDSDNDLNVLEGNLDKFNYDFEDLKIESDDEVSV